MTGAAPEPVLTVTLNPAIDLELQAPRLRRGAIARACGSSRRAGGKGINVARALSQMGVGAAAAVALGGVEGRLFVELLGRPGFALHPIAIAGGVRTNVTIARPGEGYLYKINQPGPEISARETERILGAIETLARGRKWVVLSGSLPPGMPDEVYARLARAAHKREANVAIDCEGEALLGALGEKPDLVKINRRELGATLGRPLRGRAAVIAGMRELRRKGAGLIVITNGPRPSLALDERGGLTLAKPPRALKERVFGAGDFMLAALLAGLLAGKPFADSFAEATARATEAFHASAT
ncbi:MAG: hexose kinase [Candidatus Sumerlaeia bacterium]